MKKINFFLYFAIVAIVISACSKVDLIDLQFDENAPNDGVLKILVSGAETTDLKSVTAVGDTVKIEGGNAYNFTFESTIPITNVEWNFTNNGTASQDFIAVNRYERSFNVTKVTLIAVDENGQTHSAQKWLNNLPRAGGDPVLYKGKTYMGNNLYSHEFWLYKNGAYMYNGPYYMKGNFTSPSWNVLMEIPAIDTNYRMQGDLLYPMTGGQNGHWVKIDVVSAINNHVELVPLVRELQDNDMWANFKGSNFVSPSNVGILEYYVDANGDVSPEGGSLSSLPGQGGDGFIRYSVNGNEVTIFQKNQANALNPWMQFGYNDQWNSETWNSQPLDAYPGWSKITIQKIALPARARFGDNIDNLIPNPSIPSCIYYDEIFGGLYINLIGL